METTTLIDLQAPGSCSPKADATVCVTPEKAFQDRAVSYLPLVQKIARKISRKLPDYVDTDDLYSVGVVGMMTAIDKYDSSREQCFDAYVAMRVKGSIMDELRRRDTLSRSSRSKASLLKETTERVEQQLGRKPNDGEIRDAMSLSQQQLDKLRMQTQNVTILSLERSVTSDEGEDSGLHERIADENQVNCPDVMEAEDVKTAILQSLDCLPDRQRKILAMYYYEGLRFYEIAEIFGVSEARICQIHSQALSKLRQTLAKNREF